jgi:hypothetical protein
MLTNLLGLMLSALAFIPPAGADQKAASNPEADVRAAMGAPANVLVIVDVTGHWAVFPVAEIGEVAGAKVTIKAGTFVIADCQGAGSMKKQAEQLQAKWKSRKGENYIVVSDGGRMKMLTFFIGELKEDRLFEVKTVVLAGPPK